MTNKVRSVGIWGTGSYLPEKVMTNAEFEKLVDTSDEWITSRTGIKERRFVEPGVPTSELAYQASLRALDQAGIAAEELDLIIVATVTPDMFFPSTACIVQDRLGAKKAAAFDLSAACAGFLYGVNVGSQFIATGQYEKVLVIGAETLSNIVDWTDRSTCVLFGDGAGAAVLGPCEDGEGLLSMHLGADGSGGKDLYVAAGGSLKPSSEETVKNREHFLRMSGSDVYKFAVRVMPEAAEKALELAGLSKEEVNFLVPHQANIRIIDSAAKRLGLPREKVHVNLDKYGNMSSASVPVALDEAVQNGKIGPGDVIVLVGFGGGLTWGSTAIRWIKPRKRK